MAETHAAHTKKAPTKADFDKLKDEHEAAKAQLAAERRAHAQTKDALNRTAAVAESAKAQLKATQEKLKDLEAKQALLPEAVQAAVDAGSVPVLKPDEPRWRFVANGVEGHQELLDNQADEDEARRLRPDYYFERPEDAVAAYAKAQMTELK